MTTTIPFDYAALAAIDEVARTADAVRARGIQVILVETGREALERIIDLIPAGAEVMAGASKTLQEIGFEAHLISQNHPWVNLKGEMLAQTDPAKQMALRRQSTLAPYYLGSVQAIAQTGEIVIGSASGSQLPAYAHTSQNIIWVAGTQKIVPTLDDALRRLREYSLPKENERARAVYGTDSVLAKILIVEHEPAKMQRNVNLILVNEPVGV